MILRIIFISACSLFFIQSAPLVYHEDTTFPSYFPSLNFNKDSLNKFLEHLNHPHYAELFLPFSFDHLIQFINYSIKTKQTSVFTESAFRLFLNKIKACPYISCYAFKDCLEQLTVLFKNTHFQKQYALYHQSIKNVLYDSVIDHFELLKQENELFFDHVTHDVLGVLSNPSFKQEYINNQHLHAIMLRFLECSLSKIVWPEQDGIKTWQNLKHIAQLLCQLMNIGIINKDELDDLYKSAVESYCLFLKYYGHALTDATLQTLQQEINNNATMLVLLEEQEQLLQTKKARLLEHVVFAQGCKQAQDNGMILHTLS